VERDPKVQSNVGEHCSGVLIAPRGGDSAHCLYNPRTRALLQPCRCMCCSAISAPNIAASPVARITVGPDSTARRQPQPVDWARSNWRKRFR